MPIYMARHVGSRFGRSGWPAPFQNDERGRGLRGDEKMAVVQDEIVRVVLGAGKDVFGSEARQFARMIGVGHVQGLHDLAAGGNSQALVLRHIDSTSLILLLTGTVVPGVDSAKLRAISAVEVNPVSGRYAVLGTLSGSPANANQALWTGDPTLGDDTPANQILRLPQLTLRKGNSCSTDATPQGTIRGLTLFITSDRMLTEVVLLNR